MRCAPNAILWTLIALLVVCTPSASEGEVIRFKMTGMIGVADPFNLLPPDMVAGASPDILSPPPPGSTGKEFVAYLAYDTSVPDIEPDPNTGIYDHPPADLTSAPFGLIVAIGEYTFLADTSDTSDPFSVIVTLDVPTPIGPTSGIGVSAGGVIPSFEYRFTGHTIEDNFFLSLSSTLLNSDQLPHRLDVDLRRNNRILITGFSNVMVGDMPPPRFNIAAFIDNVVRVPEPSGMAMLSLASLAFSCVVHRSGRRTRGIS